MMNRRQRFRRWLSRRSNPILLGVASIADPFATLHDYRGESDSTKADFEALKSDWQVVGSDMTEVIRRFKETLR